MVGIYKITNNINNKCYIGQSIHIKRRWIEHVTASKNENPLSLISKAIKKYGKDNFSFEILEQCKISELNEREMYWIKYYNSFGSGYNMTAGGEGWHKYDPQTIFEVYTQTGGIAETAHKIGCCETIVRQSIEMFGIKRHRTTKRPVEKIDPKTLKTVASYESLYEAQKKTGFSIDTIRDAAEGNTSNCGGFFWRFKDDPNKQFTPIKKLFKRKIIQLDIDTNKIIKEYESISDACRELGLDVKCSSSIQRVCKGTRKTAYGFKWRYKEEI